MEKVKKIIYAIISVTILIIIWTMAAKNQELLPSPKEVFAEVAIFMYVPISGYTLIGHILVSLFRLAFALMVSSVIGIFVGIMMALNFYIDCTIGTLIKFITLVPAIAWMPIMIMWNGIGESSIIIIIILGIISPIIINTYLGFYKIDKKFLVIVKTLNATKKQVFTKILIPIAAPKVVNGLKNALEIGWIILIAVEMLMADEGMGFILTRGMDYFDIPLIFVGMISIGVVKSIISLLIAIVEENYN
ncbi:ABC transporter permease [Candidatus Epulonipiscium viviparus]|uniref:ABC transporter permease n=1 Tax=Candidatus Epulonipiscium viviparus TaxID=420336 RepID=UPI0027380F1B|nr:ABC transporter permease subunit [Candidatus Epulopiscium viviparus]